MESDSFSFYFLFNFTFFNCFCQTWARDLFFITFTHNRGINKLDVTENSLLKNISKTLDSFLIMLTVKELEKGKKPLI